MTVSNDWKEFRDAGNVKAIISLDLKRLLKQLIESTEKLKQLGFRGSL